MKNQNYLDERKEKNEEVVKENISAVAKIRGSLGSMNLLRKMYNKLCRSCQAKCINKPTRPLCDYCEKCKEIISVDLKKLSGKMK